jgi:hypothetical protein
MKLLNYDVGYDVHDEETDGSDEVTDGSDVETGESGVFIIFNVP